MRVISDEPEVEIELANHQYVSVTDKEPTVTVCVKNQAGQELEGKIFAQTGYQKLSAQLPLDVYTTDVSFDHNSLSSSN